MKNKGFFAFFLRKSGKLAFVVEKRKKIRAKDRLPLLKILIKSRDLRLLLQFAVVETKP